MSESSGDRPNKFVVAMIVLIVLLVGSLAAAWWMLDSIAEKVRAQRQGTLPATGSTAPR